MQSILRRLALAVALSSAAATGHAAVLGSFDFETRYNLPSGPEPGAPASLLLHFGYSVALGGVTELETVVFDGLVLDAAAVGQTFSLVSAADDAQLPAFLARATDGELDDARYDVIGKDGGGLGLVGPENSFFVYAPGLGKPDFHGASVTGLELFITSLVIHPEAGPGSEAWSIAGQLRVLGDAPAVVPLPGAVWLLGAALPLLAARRRRG